MCHRLCSLHLVALVSFTAVYSHTAGADEAREYQQVLETWSQRLPDLERTDTGETAKDIALIRSWIGQAQAFIASEDFEKIDPIIARIEALAKYVSVRQHRIKAEIAVKKAEATLRSLNMSIAKAKKEADAMLIKVKQLDKNK